MDATTEKNLQQWLEGHYDTTTKNEIRELLKTNPQEVIDAFYTTLSFGTGGLRGLMGVGSNRMNLYTVKAATQGLANYLKRQCTGPLSVFIGYDSRHNSKEFAAAAARVFAGNGIHVHLCQELRPVPLVSFGCRTKGCSAAVMITASHNPPQYNGYKVFWNDGAQVLPPHDQGIIAEVQKINDNTQVKETTASEPLIIPVGQELDQSYIQAMERLQHYPEQNRAHGKVLKVVYSSLHGTGITLVPPLLASWGFSNLQLVNQQCIPDGAFPTVTSPNPEEQQALALGIKQMLASGSDLLLATDPDADRMGVAVNHRGSPRLLSGNEISCLCLAHICEALSTQQRLPKRPAFVKTIVTTELFRRIAESYQAECYDVLTGFKYIAELIQRWEEQPDSPHYLFGGEESFGYLLGTQVRDKDAVLSCALLCEVALQAKERGKDLVELLHDLYRKYGVYREKLMTLNFEESQAGKAKMVQAMERLRIDPPVKIADAKVLKVDDYLPGHGTLPKSDVLVFWLADGTKLVVRPSGTEPKIKLYCGVSNHDVDDLEKRIEACDRRVTQTLQAMQSQIGI
jgi:phosphomannomutase